ncbi:hypothetical protein BKA69DRAFT_1098415 [Paraphysoderma sedebokerense]|nr:hypothetical protein BKA69DRAFT_1098415 [Paraphysoderma sedebokerense]
MFMTKALVLAVLTVFYSTASANPSPMRLSPANIEPLGDDCYMIGDVKQNTGRRMCGNGQLVVRRIGNGCFNITIGASSNTVCERGQQTSDAPRNRTGGANA